MSSSDLTLRPAHAAEEAAVIALWTAAGLIVAYNDPGRDFRLARAGAASDVLVGVDAKGALCGAVMVGHDGHRGWIYYLASAGPDQGYGRAMVQGAEAWLAARGIAKINLMIRPTNTKVKGFYEHLGYEETPRVILAKWLKGVDPLARRHTYQAADGANLSYRDGGVGRPVVLLHGFLADARQNWILPGIAGALIEAGFRVIAPDFRGHGETKTVDPAGLAQDGLSVDIEALIGTLGLSDFDLIGYSLGARIAVRLVDRGLTPCRLILGGMGLSGLTEIGPRMAFFETAIRNGHAKDAPGPQRLVHAFLSQQGVAPHAALAVLRSQIETPRERLAAIAMPCLCLAGAEDQDNGSAEELAAALGRAQAKRVGGNHMSAILDPAFATAIIDFLRE